MSRRTEIGLALLVVLLAVLLVAALVGIRPPGTSPQAGGAAAAPTSAPVQCGIRLAGHDAEVVAESASASCQSLVYSYLAIMATWDPFDPTTQPPLGPSFRTCRGVGFDLTGGFFPVSVYDTDPQSLGREACSRLGFPNR